MLDEELDDTKEMNRFILEAQVLSIRDQQIAENKVMEQDYLDGQKALDTMMEVERLKDYQ